MKIVVDKLPKDVLSPVLVFCIGLLRKFKQRKTILTHEQGMLTSITDGPKDTIIIRAVPQVSLGSFLPGFSVTRILNTIKTADTVNILRQLVINERKLRSDWSDKPSPYIAAASKTVNAPYVLMVNSSGFVIEPVGAKAQIIPARNTDEFIVAYPAKRPVDITGTNIVVAVQTVYAEVTTRFDGSAYVIDTVSIVYPVSGHKVRSTNYTVTSSANNLNLIINVGPDPLPYSNPSNFTITQASAAISIPKSDLLFFGPRGDAYPPVFKGNAGDQVPLPIRVAFTENGVVTYSYGYRYNPAVGWMPPETFTMPNIATGYVYTTNTTYENTIVKARVVRANDVIVEARLNENKTAVITTIKGLPASFEAYAVFSTPVLATPSEGTIVYTHIPVKQPLLHLQASIIAVEEDGVVTMTELSSVNIAVYDHTSKVPGAPLTLNNVLVAASAEETVMYSEVKTYDYTVQNGFSNSIAPMDSVEAAISSNITSLRKGATTIAIHNASNNIFGLMQATFLVTGASTSSGNTSNGYKRFVTSNTTSSLTALNTSNNLYRVRNTGNDLIVEKAEARIIKSTRTDVVVRPPPATGTPATTTTTFAGESVASVVYTDYPYGYDRVIAARINNTTVTGVNLSKAPVREGFLIDPERKLHIAVTGATQQIATYDVDCNVGVTSAIELTTGSSFFNNEATYFGRPSVDESGDAGSTTVNTGYTTVVLEEYRTPYVTSSNNTRLRGVAEVRANGLQLDAYSPIPTITSPYLSYFTSVHRVFQLETIVQQKEQRMFVNGLYSATGVAPAGTELNSLLRAAITKYEVLSFVDPDDEDAEIPESAIDWEQAKKDVAEILIEAESLFDTIAVRSAFATMNFKQACMRTNSGPFYYFIPSTLG